MGNVISFSQIFQKFKTAADTKDTMTMAFYLGRFAYTAIYFDPIPSGSTEDGINSFQQGGTPVFPKIPPPQNWDQVQGAVRDASQVALGFIEAAVIKAAPNTTLCIGNLSGIANSVSQISSQVRARSYSELGPVIQ
jgi:hypothetical protein